jgi:hypothetical protein
MTENQIYKQIIENLAQIDDDIARLRQLEIMNAKQPPPTDTITIAELRKTDLYRHIQTQPLRDILKDET